MAAKSSGYFSWGGKSDRKMDNIQVDSWKAMQDVCVVFHGASAPDASC